MTQALHSEPTQTDLAAIAGHRPDGAFVALNLSRYPERAAYPAGTPDADLSGREAYLLYGIVAFAAIQAVGGQILWAADAALLFFAAAAEPRLGTPYGG